MDKEQLCTTIFLPDNPSDKDAFGSHERIARAISEIICEGNADNIHAIALEGAWGSGKSTVVKILTHTIQQNCNEKITIFSYDTWAYQGDSLRRSFLETLIDFFIDKNWLSKDKIEKWKKEKELLARQREETTIKTTPQLKCLGNFLAISLGLVPAGMTLATIGDDKDKIGLNLKTLGLLFTMAPFFIALYATFKFFLKRKNPAKDSEIDSLLSLFIQRTKEIQKTSTTRTPEPTAVEFAQKFKDLLNDALNGSRRLIIVMDNLDRLPAEEALKAWATMRTFFDSSPPQSLSRIYLIVPYAPEALSKIWNDKDNTSRSFIEKTFQVRFHVPPPVLSDWSNFLRNQLETAFPNHKGKPEIETIIRLFRLKGLPENRPLTPREIKLFVNQLGALHSQWQDDIPLHIQAAYLFYADNIKLPEKDLTKENFIDEEVLAIIQEDEWQKYFAAIYLNVPPDKALQVLIGQQIEKALYTGKPKSIKQYVKVPGFEQLIDDIITRNIVDWSNTQPEIIARIPITLEGLGIETPGIWETTRKGIESIYKPIEQFGPLEGKGLRILLEKCADKNGEDLAKHIIKIIKDSLDAMINKMELSND